MESFAMFFGCRVSGEKNGVKSNIISEAALIISYFSA